MKRKIAKVRRFINTDIWRQDDPAGFRGFLQRALRIILIVAREIKKDQIVVKSSALTYFTILSIVPLMALVFGISKGFGFEINVKDVIGDIFPAQEVVMTTTFEFAQNMLDNAKGGVIAGASIFVLFFTVMRLLNSIEDVFNGIWGKQRPRTWIRKFTDYLAILIVSPILIILSSSATVFLSSQIQDAGEKFQVEFYSKPLALFLATVSPYLLIWVLFTLVFIIMPNVKVSFRSGVLAGILTGTVFQLTQWGFINFSVGVAKYNAIYGSLAALPLFFIFTQLSWTIVCIGGEFSYALEKEKGYIPANKTSNFSIGEKKKVAILIMTSIVKAFKAGGEPHTKQSLSEELKIPHRFVSDSVNVLVEADLLVKSLHEGKQFHHYTPATDIQNIDICYVNNALEALGQSGMYCRNDKELKRVESSIQKINDELAQSEQNKLLLEL